MSTGREKSKEGRKEDGRVTSREGRRDIERRENFGCRKYNTEAASLLSEAGFDSGAGRRLNQEERRGEAFLVFFFSLSS